MGGECGNEILMLLIAHCVLHKYYVHTENESVLEEANTVCNSGWFKRKEYK